MSEKMELYDTPVSMEPTLPTTARSEMSALTCEILRKGGQLVGQVPSPTNRASIAALLQEMNCYYSNLIEGHKTLPHDIEAALAKDYSSNPSQRANQLLALAHITAEKKMRARLEAEPELSIHSPDFLCWIHREFYEPLPPELRLSKNASGKEYPIEPGHLRSFEVSVGRHQPPAAAALPKFLEYFCNYYSNPQILPANQLLALAAAHHRLAWIHPFGDGNGRVTRLFSQAWLIRCQADGAGLWTLSRGLALQRSDYYLRLSGADQRRAHDFDGRGNLTDKGLADFCIYFLRVMLDQIEFMGGLLQLPTLATRIERHLQIDLIHLDAKERARLGYLLKEALVEGEIERGRVGQIVNLGDTAASEITRLAIREKLMTSRTERSPLFLVFNAKNLPTYFPALYRDLPVG